MDYDCCCREIINSHVKREQELQIKHEEFKKEVAELDEQMELISRDSTSLENSFDELHHIYVKLKSIHQRLTERNKTVQQCMSEWKGWGHQDGENSERIEKEILSLQQRLVSRGLGSSAVCDGVAVCVLGSGGGGSSAVCVYWIVVVVLCVYWVVLVVLYWIVVVMQSVCTG